jgi:sensor histidine kinase YesM
VPTDPQTPEPLRPAHFLRHGLQVAVFNTVVALILWFSTDQPLVTKLVYSHGIGLSTWAIIDFGRLALKRNPRSNWPHGWPGFMLIAMGIVFGYIIGTSIGDAYSGASTWDLWRVNQRRFLAYIGIGLLFSTLASLFFYMRGRLAFHMAEVAAAERDATLARLSLLQSQLEPHMLFNTLANLRALIALDPLRAQAMLDRLIAFLRATLTASRSASHSLAAEFERLDDYLELMSVRMGSRLSTQLTLPDELRDLPVPPLLLQPLVENAVKHGLEPKVEGGHIDVTAERRDGLLALSVRDSGLGLGAAESNGPGTQFGLRQVRERLHALYGERARFSIDALPDGGTLARITLPLDPPAP